MSDMNNQMAQFARELWENYIKPKFSTEFSDIVSYYMAVVVTNDGNNRATIKRPFDDPYQVSYLDDMAGLEAGDTVLVLRFGNGTNNANHIIFGKGNGNMNYTAAEATTLASAAITTIEYGVGTSPTSYSDITSWSSNTPTWESGKYIWQRTKTNDSSYTYTCIQGADGTDGQMLYATSSTGASTAAKVATLSAGTLTLTTGATVAVTFTNGNNVANPTLNISSTGAKTIRAAGANLTATSAYNWTAGATVTFVYDGTYWQMDGTAPLLKATNAAKTATDYITDVTGGVDVSGNSATAKVEITDKVRVQADSTHFSDMTATQFKIHSGNATYPSSYMGTQDAAFAGDGAGKYLVRVFKYNPDQYTEGGALELRNADGNGRVRIDAFGDYGSQRFFNADGNYMLEIGTAGDGSYGALHLYQTTTALSNGYYRGATLGKVLASAFVNQGAPALLIYENPVDTGSGYTADLTAAYGGGAAYIRASSDFFGYVVHGKTTSHRLTFDFNTISGYNYLRFWIDGTEVYRVQQQSYSDERVKTDIKPIKSGYKEAVSAVPIEQFRYDFNDPVRQGGNGIMFGVIAQDLIKELERNKIDFKETPLVADIDNENESLYSVDYTQFLLARLAADEDRIKELEEKNAELEARLAAIEAKLA